MTAIHTHAHKHNTHTHTHTHTHKGYENSDGMFNTTATYIIIALTHTYTRALTRSFNF